SWRRRRIAAWLFSSETTSTSIRARTTVWMTTRISTSRASWTGAASSSERGRSDDRGLDGLAGVVDRTGVAVGEDRAVARGEVVAVAGARGGDRGERGGHERVRLPVAQLRGAAEGADPSVRGGEPVA